MQMQIDYFLQSHFSLLKMMFLSQKNTLYIRSKFLNQILCWVQYQKIRI